MRRHIVGTFVVMLEIICVFRHETVKEFFQVAPRRRGGILHHEQAAARMLDEQSYNSVPDMILVHQRLNFVGNFICSLTFPSNFQPIRADMHIVVRKVTSLASYRVDLCQTWWPI